MRCLYHMHCLHVACKLKHVITVTKPARNILTPSSRLLTEGGGRRTEGGERRGEGVGACGEHEGRVAEVGLGVYWRIVLQRMQHTLLVHATHALCSNTCNTRF